MSVAKVLELSAKSPQSFEAAINEGIAKASETVHGIREAWIKDMSAQIENGAVVAYQVRIKLTFMVD